MLKDFATCPHCEAKGNLGSMMPLSLETEIVSRSDGKSFHLFLMLRPQPRHAPSGGIIASEMVALFRYAHDSLGLESEPVDVTLEGLMDTTREQVNQQVQEVATCWWTFSNLAGSSNGATVSGTVVWCLNSLCSGRFRWSGKPCSAQNDATH